MARAGERDAVRLRLDIAYDGADFAGWARQPDQRTVAGVLGEALRTLFRAEVRLVVAGRTDAGVHATGQVAHIDVDRASLAALTPRHLATAGAAGPDAALVGLRRRLAGLLPPDVRVPAVAPAPDGFDARFAALRRHYAYRVCVSEWGVPPLLRGSTLWWRRPLDADAMNAAARHLLGLHDFAAYCKPRAGATTIRDLQSLEVRAAPVPAADAAGAGELLTIAVTADAFCHAMVRSIVGALLAVGDGRTDPARPAELLQAGERTAQIAVAPAHGLTLTGVDYPSDDQLHARARRTRALRRPPQ